MATNNGECRTTIITVREFFPKKGFGFGESAAGERVFIPARGAREPKPEQGGELVPGGRQIQCDLKVSDRILAILSDPPPGRENRGAQIWSLMQNEVSTDESSPKNQSPKKSSGRADLGKPPGRTAPAVTHIIQDLIENIAGIPPKKGLERIEVTFHVGDANIYRAMRIAATGYSKIGQEGQIFAIAKQAMAGGWLEKYPKRIHLEQRVGPNGWAIVGNNLLTVAIDHLKKKSLQPA
jgi:hypothetical protein